MLESLNMILQSALQAVWNAKPIFRRPFDSFPTSQTLKISYNAQLFDFRLSHIEMAQKFNL